ncbi:DUF4406 domain-containing protein [Salmonella enterica subsp. enterica serovar Bispebjerg]|uniref:DUF4406 domain-containing protein n=1 Tax=Salmonella enterica TaxID=28901 RepID=UPI0022E1488C|nr:DUF4406 domain-containing protein [Salmonella enterica]WBQ81053.1 DUF4406 domain-containing protein [Salmonella enterica subsp. enterica serovar Bispebjerg]
MNNQQSKKKVVFICGPMTGYENYNRDAFMLKEMELIVGGATVLNPAMLPDGLEREQYLTITRGMIQVSDSICLLPGWEKSNGAQQEVIYALKRNIWPMGFDNAMREKLKEVLWMAFTTGSHARRSALSNPMRPAVKGWEEYRAPHGFRCRQVAITEPLPKSLREFALLPRQGVTDAAEKLTWISGVLEGMQKRSSLLPLKPDDFGEVKAAADEAYNTLCEVLVNEVME